MTKHVFKSVQPQIRGLDAKINWPKLGQLTRANFLRGYSCFLVAA